MYRDSNSGIVTPAVLSEHNITATTQLLIASVMLGPCRNADHLNGKRLPPLEYLVKHGLQVHLASPSQPLSSAPPPQAEVGLLNEPSTLRITMALFCLFSVA